MGGYVDDVNTNPGYDYGTQVGTSIIAPQLNRGLSTLAAAMIAVAVIVLAFVWLKKH